MNLERRRGRASEETRPVAGGEAGKAITARKTLPAKARRVKAGPRSSRLQKIERFWKESLISGILTKAGSICADCLSPKEKARADIKSLIFPNDLLRLPVPSLSCRRCKKPVFFSGLGTYLEKVVLEELEKSLAKVSC